MDLSEVIEEREIAHSFAIGHLANRQVKGKTGSIRMRYHRILLIQQGKGNVIIDDRSFEFNDGEVILISKGQVVRWLSPARLTGYSVSFGDCFWERAPASASNCKAVLFNNTSAHQILKPTRAELMDLSTLFVALLDDFNKDDYINQLDAWAAYLKIIMIKLANVRTVHEPTFDTHEYIVYRQFMELLSSEFHRCRTVTDYAEMLNITSRRLSDLTRRCTGKGAKEIIDGQVLAEAKRALQFGSKTIKEIGYALHFNSAEQFSRYFKKLTGLSPIAYRSQSLQTTKG